MTAGKRRTAREMAVQMLYQSDLGGSALASIFNVFDLSEYLAGQAARLGRERPARPSRPETPARLETPANTAYERHAMREPVERPEPPDGPERPLPPLPPLLPLNTEEDPPEPDHQGRGPAALPRRPEVHDYARQRRRVEEAFQYAQTLVRGTVDHREEIDSLIRGQADNWRLERMPAVDRNILRLAIYEMLYERDTPKLVVVDEAIELAKKFGSEQSGRFINGLLDGLLKQHTFPGSLT